MDSTAQAGNVKRARSVGPRPLLVALVAGVSVAAGLWLAYRGGAPVPDTEARAPLAIALAGPFSGPSQRIGQEMEAAARFLIDRVNATGGIDGQRIELKLFDDANDAARAAKAADDIVRDPSIVAVIGHSLSATSLAAAPAYRAAGLPAVTPAATTPALTESNDVYFSTIYSDRIQGRFMAEYISRVIKAGSVAAIVGPGEYADTLSKAFLDHAAAKGLAVTTERLDRAALHTIVERLASRTDDGMVVVLFAQRADAFEIIRAVRDAKLQSPILAPDSIGDESFADRFTKLPGEIAQPGLYTSNLFVSVPFIRTIANPEARQLVDALDRSIGPLQSWIAPYAHDAAKLLVEMMRRRGQSGGAAGLRRAVLDELGSLKGGPMIVEGATGPLRFDRHGAAERPISIGIFQGGLVSSLLQLQIDSADGAGPLRLKPIVYGGLQPSRIDKVDLIGGTATVAFDIWFRHQGAIDLSGLEFDNATEPVTLGTPVQRSEIGGVQYVQYSTKGTFKLNFNRSPASPRRHLLQIAVHQSRRGDTNIAFVPDSLGLPAISGPKLAAYLMGNLSDRAGWRFIDAELAPHFAATPAKGDPAFLSRRMSVFPQPGLLFTAELAESTGSWQDLVDADLATLGLIAALLGLCTFRVATGRWPLADRPRLELLALAAVALAALAVTEASFVQRIGGNYRQMMVGAGRIAFDCLWWFIPALLVNVAIGRFVWSPLEAATRQAVPRVIKHLVSFVVLMLSLFGIIAFVFDRQITSLLATSGLVAMIIGLAIQSNISHIFSGIALNIERPFRPGDWIKVGDITGKVVDISWRSTKLETFANTTISIPNSKVGNGTIENFTFPNQRYFIFQILYFGLEHDPARVTALIYDALKVVKSVDGRERLGLMWVKYNGIDPHGQKFLVAFDCTDRMLKNSQEHVVLVSIYKVLARCGVHPTTTNVNMHVHRAIPDLGEAALGVDHLVAHAAILAPLDATEKARLAAQAVQREFNAGEDIVRQGEAGDSMFLIAQGVVNVMIDVKGKDAPLEVARLGAGDCFGEMALLTGAARSSTVRAMDYCRLYEIPKQALQPIIEHSHQLGERLGSILAERQLQNETSLSRSVELEQAKREITRSLMGRILRYFATSQSTAAN